MNMTRIKNNTTAQLVSLIRPEWDGYSAAQRFGLDSFIRIESPWVQLPKPPLFSVISHYDFFKKTLEAYEGYIQSIEEPRAFAGAWTELTSLMLGTMATIAGGLYAVLTNIDQSAPGEPTVGESEVAAIKALYPDIDSLRRLYGATDSFYKNEPMLNRWEGIFLRGQKHLMGNIVLFVSHIDFLLKHDVLNFEGLSALLTDLDGLFNPFEHTTRAYDADKIGGWLEFSIDGSEAPPVGYWTNPKLRRVTDEIIYEIGASAKKRSERDRYGMAWRKWRSRLQKRRPRPLILREGDAGEGVCDRVLRRGKHRIHRGHERDGWGTYNRRNKGVSLYDVARGDGGDDGCSFRVITGNYGPRLADGRV